jgi:hypothetical protein
MRRLTSATAVVRKTYGDVVAVDGVDLTPPLLPSHQSAVASREKRKPRPNRPIAVPLSTEA